VSFHLDGGETREKKIVHQRREKHEWKRRLAGTKLATGSTVAAGMNGETLTRRSESGLKTTY